LRCIELPEAMADWSLTSLQLKLIKIGARVVRHARTHHLPAGPRSLSPARWYAPSSPLSADCERHRYAHDRDPRSKLNESGLGQICPAALKNAAPGQGNSGFAV
jgi:hypothetical protein